MSTAEPARRRGRPPTDRALAAAIGARVAARRGELGLNQGELARGLGVVQSTVADWESGFKSPAPHHVPRLCRALRIDPNTLFGWEDTPH